MPGTCEKCGGKLDPKGNFCTECLLPVTMARQMAEEERAKAKRLPVRAIAIAAAAFVLFLSVVIYVKTRPLPPERVAQKWIDELVSYRVRDAMRYTTERYEASSNIGDGRQASYAKADEFKDAVDNEAATYTFSPPRITPGPPERAVISLVFKQANGDSFGYEIKLVRQPNGRWLIDRVD